MEFNGTRGIMCECAKCGRNVFLHEISGRFIYQGGDMFIRPSKYEGLPEGWGTENNGNPVCPRCRVKSIHGDSAVKTIWARLGVTLYVTKEQHDTIMGDDHDKAEAEFESAINEGRYEPDGDSYIPMENGDEIEFYI